MFYDCDALVDVFIPETVKRIEQYAFSECESLKNVVLPVSINFIGDAAFYDCYYLESIMYMGSQSGWDAVNCGADWCTNAGTSTQNGFCALMYLDGEYVPGADEDNGTEGLSFILNNEGNGYEFITEEFTLFNGASLISDYTDTYVLVTLADGSQIKVTQSQPDASGTISVNWNDNNNIVVSVNQTDVIFGQQTIVDFVQETVRVEDMMLGLVNSFIYRCFSNY
jgi:hypothetical protein